MKKDDTSDSFLRDAKLFEELAKVYEEKAATLKQLAEDEKAVLALVERGELDDAVELMNGALKTYAPGLKIALLDE